MEPTSILLLSLSISALWGPIIGIGGFILALGLAIFIHELGHFAAAKAFGVPVERFVIGMDKEAIPFLPGCIWEKKIGETTYGISLIPLGGYVKMSGVLHPDIEKYIDGESNTPTAQDGQVIRPDGTAAAPQSPDSSTLQGQAMQDMAALYKKPYYQKVIIYSAGVIMNIILAMVVIGLLYTVGFNRDAPFPTTVGWMTDSNRFAQTELQPGDKITSVSGKEVKDSNEFFSALGTAFSPVGESEEVPTTVTLTVVSAATGQPYDFPLGYEDVPTEDFADAFLSRPAYIERVIPNDPADKAGMKRGDTVTAINDFPIVDWSHFRNTVSSSPETELSVAVLRGDQELVLTITPTTNPEDSERGLIGVMPGNPNKEFVQESVFVALVNAPERTVNITTRYLSALGGLASKLSTGNVSAVRRDLGGPVGIAQMAYREAQHGISEWLNFLIILNVALAVMNLLPFPVLDGGHIVFATYEAIFRKPLPPQVLIPIMNVAVYALLIFFLLVTASDLLKIFT